MKINKNYRITVTAALAAVFFCALASGCVSSAGRSAARKAPRFSDLLNREWRLTAIQDTKGNPIGGPAGDGPVFSRQELEELGMGDAFTLTFDGERVSGKGAPNRYFSPCEAGAGQTLSIQAIAGTLMMALVEPQGLTERGYFDYLEQVFRWDLVQGRLYLFSETASGDGAVLIYD
jgi:hypothetical protein